VLNVNHCMCVKKSTSDDMEVGIRLGRSSNHDRYLKLDWQRKPTSADWQTNEKNTCSTLKPQNSIKYSLSLGHYVFRHIIAQQRLNHTETHHFDHTMILSFELVPNWFRANHHPLPMCQKSHFWGHRNRTPCP